MKIIGHTTFDLDYGINFENVATFITNTALIELKEKEIDLRRKTKLQKFFKKWIVLFMKKIEKSFKYFFYKTNFEYVVN